MAHGNLKITDEQVIEVYNENPYRTHKDLVLVIKDRYNISIDRSNISKRIKRLKASGDINLDCGVKVDDSTVLKGISRYHKLADGGVWVKSDVEKTKQLESLKEGITDFYQNFESKYETVTPPTMTDEDTLTFYPLPDMHWGLLTHGEELQHGENFDLKIQEQWVLGAMKYLVDSSKPTKKCIIADLGDVLHSMDDSKQTKSGHHLDVDGRTHKIVKVMFSAFTRLIDLALAKHEIVEVYSVAGNHSDLAGLYLKAHLSAWYKDEPRVVINESEKSQQYAHFGKCVLGFTHGHELKPARAGEVLVADNMHIISSTEHRYFHFGHFHSDQKDRSYSLCEVEIHSNNVPRDKWADGMGFRGKLGEAKAITYHKEYGEIGRSRFNINMIRDK